MFYTKYFIFFNNFSLIKKINGNKICFIHNGNKINYEENQKIYQFFMEKEPIIIVIDKDNLISDAPIQES